METILFGDIAQQFFNKSVILDLQAKEALLYGGMLLLMF